MFEGPSVDRIFGSRHDRAAGDKGRYQDRRNSNTKTIEGEGPSRAGISSLGGVVVGRASRGHNVIVEPAMLIVDNQQDRALPQAGVGANGIVYGGNETLAL